MNSQIELCPVCGDPATFVRESREVKLGQRRVMVEDERWHCVACEEDFYTPEQADATHARAIAAVRAEDGLLAPGKIREIRIALGMTQGQFEELLGVGPKTVVRWETGRVCQNKATDRLIRLAAANRANVELLAAINGVAIRTGRNEERADPTAFERDQPDLAYSRMLGRDLYRTDLEHLQSPEFDSGDLPLLRLLASLAHPQTTATVKNQALVS